MTNETLNTLLSTFMLVLAISPLVISIVRYIGVKTNNRKVITLADRAAIIVSALDNVDMENVMKKQTAVDKLLTFASETKINLDLDQASDYIEDAVRHTHMIAYGKEENQQ